MVIFVSFFFKKQVPGLERWLRPVRLKERIKKRQTGSSASLCELKFLGITQHLFIPRILIVLYECQGRRSQSLLEDGEWTGGKQESGRQNGIKISEAVTLGLIL